MGLGPKTDHHAPTKWNSLLNGPTSASFLFIFVFSYNNKHLVASGIRTRIFGAVGESADQYTTTQLNEIVETINFFFKTIYYIQVPTVEYVTQKYF